ncbi:aspartate/glutamate racemase family protein [Vibrio olivae]|uniref:Aspartate/glutamate racemase family protein n=1 Tax=Vibrio olivae TaxID=1243002 RepID=A0ABV5HKZ9_9VIBR
MVSKVGVLRVVSSEDRDFLECHQRLMEQVCPGKQWESRCLPEQPNGIHDPQTFAEALPKILFLGTTWQRDIDVLVVSCAADPGVGKLRELLNIPVIGAGEACCKMARQYGNVIGILGIEPEQPATFTRALQGCKTLYLRPDNVHCTHDIHSDQGRASIIAAALELQRKGAQVIALACTGMATTDVVSLLAPHCELPVINPVMAAGELLALRYPN